VRAYAERFGWEPSVARLCTVFRDALARGAA
jgi:hypothetical protein